MFTKGSRYRNLPQSTHLTAAGENLLGANLRLIATPGARFQHMVQQRERLDLLAFKYYSDATRWWLIADANPSYSFPTDVLDRDPIVDEFLSLTNTAYLTG